MLNHIDASQIRIPIQFTLTKPTEKHLMVIFLSRDRKALCAAFVERAGGTYKILSVPPRLDTYNARHAIFERMNAHKVEELVQPQTDSPDVIF